MGVTPEELARTMVRRHGEALERARARARTLRAELGRTVAEEMAAGTFRRAWLVGSLAWGSFGATSDVDLVVEGLCEEGSARLWDRLCQELGTRVDLLRLESLPPEFAQRVLREGEPLHVP